MALHFTVFFPNRGWDKDERHTTGGKTVTAKEFAVFHLAERDPSGPGGMLLTLDQIFERVGRRATCPPWITSTGAAGCSRRRPAWIG